jgi:hypothetical protein
MVSLYYEWNNKMYLPCREQYSSPHPRSIRLGEAGPSERSATLLEACLRILYIHQLKLPEVFKLRSVDLLDEANADSIS